MPDLWYDVDTALAEVPVNIFPLTDDTDFKSRETGITYDQAGMDLVWNFFTTAGAATQTAVTPTTGGNYDWAHLGDGMYTIEIPASGGASINNDTEGFGWFTGYATGVLPWRGPTIGFRAAALNNSLVDGTTIDVNVTAISGDTTSADNLESYTDGTTPIPANATQISGDSTAADNAELFFDGTGYNAANSAIGTVATATAVTTVNGLAAGVVTAASIAANAITSDELATTALEEIADYVWDEVLTAATHNVASSAGRRLRTLDSNEMRAGTCQAGSISNTIRLDAGASAVDGWYDPALVIIDGGTGEGQCRLIIDYVGATQTCIVNKDWRLTPDGTSTFIVVSDPGLDTVNEGQAVGGAANSITLNSHARAINDTYNGCTVVIVSGTGRGQSRVITDYDGGTKVALVSEAWATQPVAGTGYYIFGYGRSHLIPEALDDVADAVWDELIAGHAGAGSAGLALSSASAPTVGQIADAVWDEDATGHIAANSVGFYMRAAYALSAGRLRIDDTLKQLVLYMPDGVTEIARWNLYNNAGALASTNVFDRQRT